MMTYAGFESVARVDRHRSRLVLCFPVQDRCAHSLAEEFTRCDEDDVDHCTESRNQHVPQYRGSC